MGRYKKKVVREHEGDGGDGGDGGKDEVRAIKCSLNTILQPQHRELITKIFHDRSWRMTKISVLASLLLLFKTNKALDDNDLRIFNQNGNHFIRDIFNTVIEDGSLYHLMPTEFREMIQEENPGFVWPDGKSIKDELTGRIILPHMMNAFIYFYGQFTTNIETNINTHFKPRLNYFLRCQCYRLNLENGADGDHYDNIDIRNTMNAVFNDQDWTGGDAARVNKRRELWSRIVQLGFPLERPHCFDLRSWVKFNWFKSIPMFMKMQREVEDFIENIVVPWNEAKQNNDPEIGPKPPKVSNFCVIPLCRFQLKHTRFDHSDMYDVASRMKLLPRYKNAKTNRMKRYDEKDYEHNKDALWNIFFDMNKINRMDKNKDFHYQIVTDSVSVPVLYTYKRYHEKDENIVDNKTMKEELYKKLFTYEVGIDPNDKTWLAVVRRDIKTGYEENVKISNPRFHWGTEDNKRKKKAEKLVGQYDAYEKADLASYPKIPSPRGKDWRVYLKHRAKVLHDGMAAYAKRTYARLELDHHIKKTREMDKVAVKITKNKSTILYIGGAPMAANRPIGIKKRKRCPGVRHLVASVKKLMCCCCCKYVDEWGTSQTCANCYRKFARNTRAHRFKVCRGCKEDERAGLPGKITTLLGRRMLKWLRFNKRRERVRSDKAVNDRLVPKVIEYLKKWRRNGIRWVLVDGHWVEKLRTVVWHRDIVAAKNIMYKGRCKMLGICIHESLQRPPPPWVQRINRWEKINQNTFNSQYKNTIILATKLVEAGLDDVVLAKYGGQWAP